MPEQFSIGATEKDVGSCFKIKGAKTTQGVAINSNILEKSSSRDSVMVQQPYNDFDFIGNFKFLDLAEGVIVPRCWILFYFC